MNAANRTLAALGLMATVGAATAASVRRHRVRGESMKPTLEPGDTVVSLACDRPLGLLRRPRVGDIAVIRLPWEHDLVGIKRLVAGPGEGWFDGDGAEVRAGPGWVAAGDEPTLSTDSRHHGRVPTEALLGVVVLRVSGDQVSRPGPNPRPLAAPGHSTIDR